jgi:hypothetical protein
MINEYLLERLTDNECLLADGYDDALIGISEGYNPLAIYDIDLCIKCLVESDGISEEDALEHFYFNTVGYYVGEKTPIFMRTFE